MHYEKNSPQPSSPVQANDSFQNNNPLEQLQQPRCSINRNQVVPDQVIFKNLSTVSLLNIFEFLEMPVSPEYLKEFARALTHPSTPLNKDIILNDQSLGCYTTMVEMLTYDVGLGHVQSKRSISLRTISNDYTVIVATLELDKAGKQPLMLKLSLDRDIYDYDSSRFVWNSFDNVIEEAGCDKPPSVIETTPDVPHSDGSISLKLSDNVTMKLISQGQLLEHTPHAAPINIFTPRSKNIPTFQFIPIGCRIWNPTIEELQSFAEYFDGSPEMSFANFDRAQGASSLLNNVLSSVKDEQPFSGEVWELFKLKEQLQISIVHRYEIGDLYVDPESPNKPITTSLMYGPMIKISGHDKQQRPISLLLGYHDSPIERDEVNDRLSNENYDLDSNYQLAVDLCWGKGRNHDEAWDIATKTIRENTEGFTIYDPKRDSFEIIDCATTLAFDRVEVLLQEEESPFTP